MILRRFSLLGLRQFGLVLLISALAFAFACGSADTDEEDGGGGAPAAAVEEVASGPPGVEIVSTDAVYTEDDLVNTPTSRRTKTSRLKASTKRRQPYTASSVLTPTTGKSLKHGSTRTTRPR